MFKVYDVKLQTPKTVKSITHRNQKEKEIKTHCFNCKIATHTYSRKENRRVRISSAEKFNPLIHSNLNARAARSTFCIFCMSHLHGHVATCSHPGELGQERLSYWGFGVVGSVDCRGYGFRHVNSHKLTFVKVDMQFEGIAGFLDVLKYTGESAMARESVQ